MQNLSLLFIKLQNKGGKPQESIKKRIKRKACRLCQSVSVGFFIDCNDDVHVVVVVVLVVAVVKAVVKAVVCSTYTRIE